MNMVFPRIPSPIEEEIMFTICKKVWKCIQNMARQKPVDEKSSALDIATVSEGLRQFKLQVLQDVNVTIEQIERDLNSYTEELLILFNEKEKFLRKCDYSQRNFDKALKRLRSNTREFFHREINLHLSLDNTICCRILSLPSGEKKERELKEFASSVIETATVNYIEDFRELLKNLYDSFELDMEEVIEKLSSTEQNYKQLYDAVNFGDLLQQEQYLMESKSKLCFYDAIIKRMEA